MSGKVAIPKNHVRLQFYCLADSFRSVHRLADDLKLNVSTKQRALSLPQGRIVVRERIALPGESLSFITQEKCSYDDRCRATPNVPDGDPQNILSMKVST